MRSVPAFRLGTLARALAWMGVLWIVHPWAAGAQGVDASGPSLIALVRHAERDGPSASDPGLTEGGERRAEALAHLLSGAGITGIHATDTRRARATATPLSAATGIPIQEYSLRELAGFAGGLLTTPGRHLVVGHSNTTDELSVLLGAESFGPLEEAWEYDRLYLLAPGPDGRMRATLLRFGDPPPR